MSNRISMVAIGATDPQPSASTDHHGAMLHKSPEQRQDYIERARHAAARAAHEEREAKFNSRVEEAMKMAVGTVGGQIVRMTTNGGESPIWTEASPHSGLGGGYMASNPDAVDVYVGGLSLSAAQAKALLADGTITRDQYSAAVTEAMQPYQPGYKHSFR